MQTCITCHQPTGLGLPPVFPPLAGTEYTQGPARRMIAMTLRGVNPPLKVKEATYAVPMPPLPTQFPLLADDNKLAGRTVRRIGTHLPPLRRQRRDLPRALGVGIDRALRPRAAERGKKTRSIPPLPPLESPPASFGPPGRLVRCSSR